MGLEPCCCNSWWTTPVKERAKETADLMPGGSCTALLKAMFNGKIFNIEVETNFARMESMKRVGRGRSDLASSLSAKHILAEAKLGHVRELLRNRTNDGADASAESSTGMPCVRSKHLRNSVSLHFVCLSRSLSRLG